MIATVECLPSTHSTLEQPPSSHEGKMHGDKRPLQRGRTFGAKDWSCTFNSHSRLHQKLSESPSDASTEDSLHSPDLWYTFPPPSEYCGQGSERERKTNSEEKKTESVYVCLDGSSDDGSVPSEGRTQNKAQVEKTVLHRDEYCLLERSHESGIPDKLGEGHDVGASRGESGPPCLLPLSETVDALQQCSRSPKAGFFESDPTCAHPNDEAHI